MDFYQDAGAYDHDSSMHDHFAKDGTYKGVSIDNGLGGKSYWDSHGVLKGATEDNFIGGQNYFGPSMNFLGHSIPGPGLFHFEGADGQFHSNEPGFLNSDHVYSMRINLLNNIR